MAKSNSALSDSPIILGLWPLAGITTIGVTRDAAEATLHAAVEHGITCFDTAFSYGYDGESDRLLGWLIRGDRERFTVIGKVGQRWTASQQRVVDGSAKTLTADAETSLRRIGIPDFDLLMLHSPDPQVPIQQSAETLRELQRRGLCRHIGVCNVTPDQRRTFVATVGPAAIECPLNLLQRECLSELIPQSAADHGDVLVYWTLMKGLLAGRIGREHQFAPGDSRPKYEIFQGQSRRTAHDLIDQLKQLATGIDMTVAQLSIGWTLAQAGVSAALVGARRPEQIIETAATRALTDEVVEQIDKLVSEVTGPSTT